ncbi:MAG: PDZ domain-containing protein [Oligoflexia bacterium]|nr:PDZ domain-containing protein [Oligoflexia bacterium]
MEEVNKKTEQEFCMKQFRPVVGIILILLIAVIISTIFFEHRRGGGGNGGFGSGLGGFFHRGDGGGTAKGYMHRMANTTGGGKLPIQIGAKMVHPNYGQNCLMCHSVAGGDKKPAIPAGPITPDATLIHPFWGECVKCHKITGAGAGGAGGKPVAYINTVVGKNIWGANCITVTSALAEQYNLPTTTGVLVNDVEKNSFADQVGIQEGDIIQSINNQDVAEVGQVLLALADKNVGDVLKLKVVRNKRKTKNLKFKMTDLALSTTSKPNKFGIMSSGADLNSPVAYSFVNAIYLLVYDLTNSTFYAVKNPFRGSPNHQVANWVVSQKVGNVAVGNINESDLLNLQQANIKVFAGVFGRASDAVTLYQRGTLTPKLEPGQVALTNNKVNMVAIPVNFPDPAANITPRMENAHYFIKIELDKNKFEAITNPEFGHAKNDGALVAQFLADNEIDVVIANQISGDTLIELKKLNIGVYPNVVASVEEAIRQFQNNKLNSL